ncbi:MAG: putative ATP-grasp-modified RiPP [Pseudonocardiaceae bacterium]
MNSSVQVEPFGLTFRVPVPSSAVPSEAIRTAVYDQQRQMALFNGRPLSELSAEERITSSSPTETDGKDPIAVDTDPVYD